MNILFKSVRVIDQGSDYHQQLVNLHVKDGRIAAIGSEEPEAEQVISEEGLCVSAGWFDLYAQVGDPGLEHKEDFDSAAAAAARGGFTEVACLPLTEPVTQTKNAVSYIQNRSKSLPVTFHPIAAVTANLEGKDLTEMIDLHQAGAVAFSDGENGLQNADVLLKALQYLQYVDGLLLTKPVNMRLNEHGQMHEGKVSTLLGMKGLPSLSEEIMVNRDLQLLAYAGGKIHFSLISCAGSVQQIREAKAKGMEVSCSVATYQLAFTDETVVPFDTNYKINPPFRSAQDRDALLAGLADGTIDVLVSGHMPQDVESKKLEFDLAEFGVINLETAFAAANTQLAHKLNLEKLVEKLTVAPRQLLKLPVPKVKKDEMANLTFFHPDKIWVPVPEQTQSKSQNSPFYGQELKGQVMAIIHQGQAVFNPVF